MTESSRDDRINKIIADYLTALEQGQAPDQQAFLDRHPDLAGELQAFFRDQEHLQRFAAGLAPAAGSEATVDLGSRPQTGAETIAPTGPVIDSVNAQGIVRYFGDYQLVEEIARGGMGVVYKARQVKLNRIVAVKMILSGQLANAADVKRFYAEAEAAADLHHPNIVAIHEIGEHEGQHYFSMDYVEGKSLAALAHGHPLEPMRAARYVQLIAAAIQHAHDKGILHRDLKPSNVLIDKHDQPRVTDFGLAKRHDPASENTTADAAGSPVALTVTGQVLGTPGYMPPEQARGEPVGPWADVYSLGAVLYELLTGRAPFTSANMFETLAKVIHEEPVAPRRLQAGLPRDLETICLKCLQKEPAARYASAQALAEDLRRFQVGEPIMARPVGRLERVLKWTRRHPARAMASLLFVLLATVVAVGSVIASLWMSAETARDSAENAYSAESKAKTALEKANRALTLSLLAEQTARGVANDAKEKLARYLYLDRVALAWKECDAGNYLTAQALLADCEEKYRNWEWHHLDSKIPRPLATLTGHLSLVTHVCFSPNGKLLASASRDHSVKVWEVLNGKNLATLTGHKNQVMHVDFSPDGQRLASASLDGTVKLWDVATAKIMATLVGHKGEVEHVWFSPDGQRLASHCSSGDDHTVKLWNATNGNLLANLEGHKNGVSNVCFSPDGMKLASASYDETVKLWDVVSGKELATLPHKSPNWNCGVSHVTFSPDGQRLASATSYEKTVRLWDTNSHNELAKMTGHQASVNWVAFSPDGHQLASASSDRTVKLWNVATGKELATLAGPREAVMQVRFSPDGQRLASPNDDGTVWLWDATTGKPLTTLAGHRRNVWQAVFSPDGQCLASASADGTVKVWETAFGKELVSLGGHKDRVGVIFSPDGRTLASQDSAVKSVVKLWDAKTGHAVGVLGGEGRLVFSSDGRLFATIGLRDTVTIWEASTAKKLTALTGHKGNAVQLLFSPDGQTLTTLSNNTVRFWDVATGKERHAKIGANSATQLSFSADGRRFALGPMQGTYLLWDPVSETMVATLKADQAGGISRAIFSPRGQFLACVNNDNTLTLRDAVTGKELVTLHGHKQIPWDLAFSRDSKRLASASRDGMVKLWDIETGRELLTLTSHTEENVLNFSPDGSRLTSNGGGIVELWDVAAGSLLANLPGQSAATFSPDGQRIATADQNLEAVKLWDALTGRVVAVLTGLKGGVVNVSFSPDGQQIAAGSRDGAAKLWFSKVNPATWTKRKADTLEQRAADDFQAGQWFAAAFHLRQLLQQRPGDAELQRQLSHAETEWNKLQNSKRK